MYFTEFNSNHYIKMTVKIRINKFYKMINFILLIMPSTRNICSIVLGHLKRGLYSKLMTKMNKYTRFKMNHYYFSNLQKICSLIIIDYSQLNQINLLLWKVIHKLKIALQQLLSINNLLLIKKMNLVIKN